MVCRWYAELLLLVVTVVQVLAQTVEYQNLGTGIQAEVEENTQEPEVTSSSGLSYDAKLGLGLGISTVSVVIAAIGLGIAYKRCIIDKDRRRAEIRAEQRDIERLGRERREEERQRKGLNREREEAEQNSVIDKDIAMAGIQETVGDEPDNSPSAQENEASTTTPLLGYDIPITASDILIIIRIFSLAQLDNVYIRLRIPRKDIDNILQEDNVPQLKAKKVLFYWLDTNKTTKTRKMLTDAIGKVPECTRSLAGLQREWGQETDQQAVSDADIQDIVDKFSLTDLEDVYINLGLEVDEIKNVKQAVYRPRTPNEAKEILTQWRNKRNDATRGMMIKAIGECKDCTAGLTKLKDEWSQSHR